jgi:hypothetical protein
LSKKSKNLYRVVAYQIPAYIFANVKKIISIFFIFVFMFQALPVKHWVKGFDKNISMEMAGDMDLDGGEKNNNGKEVGKDCKENIIPQKHFYNKQIAYNSTQLRSLSSENAIILHHAEVSTPPPDFKG